MSKHHLASRLVIATVAALTLTTVNAPAEAASRATWNRVAQCESGGRWHINTGNGYYGGLQISSATWKGYGGRKFARQANRATKPEQIKVAERILRGQGWGAWPNCH